MIEGYYPKEPTEYLRFELELRKRRNANYSIRAFARDLNLSPSHLSEFLSGKASLSSKKAEELSSKLRLTAPQKEHWNDLLNLNSRTEKQRKVARLKVTRRLKDSKSYISLDAFKVIADWYHFAILAFFGANESYSMDELKESLKVPLTKVKRAVKRLSDLDLIERSGKGFRPVSQSSFTGDSIPSEAIRESHRQILQKAMDALEEIDMAERESQSLFFSVPKKKLPELREVLKKRILEVLSEYSVENLSKEESSIQAFTWHLFPIQKKDQNHEV